MADKRGSCRGTASLETCTEDDYQEHELAVTFQYHEWEESHPYGDTYAYESCSEVTDEEYELDGESITREELVKRFGEKEVASAIERATERGIDNFE